MGKNTKSSLFMRLSLFFFVFLLVVVGIIGVIFIRFTINYEQETNQKLNRNIAGQIVKDASPFLNGEVDDSAMQDLMHYLMTINPSIEIYVLDTEGEILSFVAPHKVVKLEQVDTSPITEFIEADGETFIKGDDPRNPGRTKVFSAAPVLEGDKLIGYVYVILASQEYAGIAESIINSSWLQIMVKTLVVILILSFLIGIIVFRLTTRNISHIIQVFSRYKSGDMSARVSLKTPRSEYALIQDTFNDMADSLEQKITQIHEVDQMRKELIANISHDLRTPVSSVRGYTELLMDNDNLSEEDKRKYLEIIDMNSKKMEKQIQDLFELSKLESTQYKLNKEPVHLSELITDSANKYRVMANKRGVHINAIFSRDLPTIHADIALMDRAIQNLIDNALKYTDKGGTINIEIGHTADDIVITVSDTGAGIPEEELPHVFDRFRTGSKNEANSAGLGLAIVKKILDHHNSTIRVESAVRKGTKFTLNIPISAN